MDNLISLAWIPFSPSMCGAVTYTWVGVEIRPAPEHALVIAAVRRRGRTRLGMMRN